MQKRRLTSAEIRAHFGIARPTLYDWRRAGMPCERIAYNCYLYELSDVEKWLEKYPRRAPRTATKADEVRP